MRGHEFTIVQDFYAEVPNKEGDIEVVLVKKDLKTKWYCRDLEMVTSFGQAFNMKGNIRIHRSIITVNGEEITVQLPYSKTKALLATAPSNRSGFNISKR